MLNTSASLFSYANTPRFIANPRYNPQIPRIPNWRPPVELNVPRANGYVIYEGPSRFKPDDWVVVIATGFISPSENTKTGEALIQTWILLRDVNPSEAVAIAQDNGICGNCVHMGQVAETESGIKKRVGRSCYVTVQQAPLGVWRSYHGLVRNKLTGRYEQTESSPYPSLSRDQISPLFRSIGRHRVGLRIGSYGDPVAVPSWVWEEALGFIGESPKKRYDERGFYEIENANVPFWTGYTHAWKRSMAAPYRGYLMASVDTAAEQAKAMQEGWRTFRVSSGVEPRIAGVEVVCPASEEGGFRTTCDACFLCMGACKVAQNIVIAPHGFGKKTIGKRLRELGDSY